MEKIEKLNLKMIKELYKAEKDYNKDDFKSRPYARKFNAHIEKLKKLVSQGADINLALNTVANDENFYKIIWTFFGKQPQSLIKLGLDASKLDERVRDEFYQYTSDHIENNKDILNVDKEIITLSSHPNDLFLLHAREYHIGKRFPSVLARCELGEMLLKRDISSQALKFLFMITTIVEIFSLFSRNYEKMSDDDFKSLYNYFEKVVQVCPTNLNAVSKDDPYIDVVKCKPDAFMEAINQCYYVCEAYAHDERSANNIFPFYKLLLDNNCNAHLYASARDKDNILNDKFKEYFENKKPKQSKKEKHTKEKPESLSTDEEVGSTTNL